jgi:hypothetical protein
MKTCQAERLLGCLILSCLCLFALGRSADRKPELTRTIKVKIAVDEEWRKRPGGVYEIRKWMASASKFFEQNFGLRLEITKVVPWASDNTKGSLIALCPDLYKKVDRGDCDIVVGCTYQIPGHSEPGGVAAYLHGYILIRRVRSNSMNRLALIHELCHLFGAVDLEEKKSIMSVSDPELACDEFTSKIVRLHKDRRFDRAHFPLPSSSLDPAIALYLERKQLDRREAGIHIMLALLYVRKENYDAAGRECLEAERIDPSSLEAKSIRFFISKHKK